MKNQQLVCALILRQLRYLHLLALPVICFFGATVNGYAGIKYAVFVGVGDYAQASKLDGPVLDAVKMNSVLIGGFGFNQSNTTLLTDTGATKSAILEAFKKYQGLVKEGDTFVFYYSGHGSLFPDALSDEHDETVLIPDAERYPYKYYDSALLPIDFHLPSGKNWKRLILDDELFDLFSVFTAKGAQVIFISDSCHAGTLAKSLSGKTIKYQPLTETSLWEDLKSISPNTARTPVAKKDLGSLYLVIASSEDNETSLVYSRTSPRVSLFTYAFLASLESLRARNQPPTYRNLMNTLKPAVAQIARDQYQGHLQNPRFDDRFFKASLDTPLFEFPKNAITSGSRLRILIRVTDSTGNPIEKANIGIFDSDGVPQRGNITAQNTLLVGTTDSRGILDSINPAFPKGFYWVKVVAGGYRAFTQKFEIKSGSQPGTAVLSFKLARE